MNLTLPHELLVLGLLRRWEDTAPADQHQGLLDGEPEQNTQTSRFAYVLDKVSIIAGGARRVFESMELNTERRDGRSYVSTNWSSMQQPHPLGHGWYFEGCCSLKQKKDFLGHLMSLGLSPDLVACARDFVEGKGVQHYQPPEWNCSALVRIGVETQSG